MTILYALAWYLIGMAGFAFWWSREWGSIKGEVPTMLFIGIAGPFTWFIGWMVHGGRR